ncbi:hypothetical protein [Mycobacterium celatum]|nr:hypothetical protein [Mycobacterium celatum]
MNEFSVHDMRLLGALSDRAIDAQFEARQKLFNHIDTIWQEAKRSGHRPADNMETWGSVAAMRDLSSDLLQNIDVVRYNRDHPDTPIGG